MSTADRQTDAPGGTKGNVPVPSVAGSRSRLSSLRRLALLLVIGIFLLQFLKVNVLVGGLTGSIAVSFVKFLDVFAYTESLVASRDFTADALLAVLPVAGIYLVFGRAFCGWVCPMDFLYELVGRVRNPLRRTVNIPSAAGYVLALSLLAGSALLGVPLFTKYLSHLTNFFRLMTGGVFLALDLPVEVSVVTFSAAVLACLLVLEFFFPRLWCRVLCPVGKTYGLFNKASVLTLRFEKAPCARCSLCNQQCYMGVKIEENAAKPGLRDLNCIYCNRCAEGCAAKNGLVRMKLRWRR